MTDHPGDRAGPAAGTPLPLAESVREARAALARAVELLEAFQRDPRYPAVTRGEAAGVIGAIREADALAARLDPPFVRDP